MWKEIKWRRNKGKRMTKIMIGLGTGMAVLTAIILGLVYDENNDGIPKITRIKTLDITNELFRLAL